MLFQRNSLIFRQSSNVTNTNSWTWQNPPDSERQRYKETFTKLQIHGESESEAATAEEGIFLNGEIKADEKANFAYFAIDDINWIC